MTSSSGAELYEQPTYPLANTTTNGTNGHAPPPEPPPADTGPVVAPTSPAAVPSSAAQVPAGSGPRLARREQWVPLPEEYHGFRIKVWLNYPQHWDEDILWARSFRPRPDEDAPIEEHRAWQDEREQFQRQWLGKVVLEHNGWLDYDGAPLPQPQDPMFWELIPTELAATIIAILRRETTELPNSLPPKSKRR